MEKKIKEIYYYEEADQLRIVFEDCEQASGQYYALYGDQFRDCYNIKCDENGVCEVVLFNIKDEMTRQKGVRIIRG